MLAFSLRGSESIFLGSKLLNCYAKFGLLAESRWVFDRIIDNNLSLWNSILVGYFQTSQFGEILRWYLNLSNGRLAKIVRSLHLISKVLLSWEV